MTIISTDTALKLPEQEPKEMLTVKKLLDGRQHVKINYSSYDLLNLCHRKAYYTLERKLINKRRQAPALTFGSAVHKALEIWYCSPLETRKRDTKACKDWQDNELQRLTIQTELHEVQAGHGACARCGSIYAFLEMAAPLNDLPAGDKRRPEMGLTILNNYFNTYLTDNFTVVNDDLGPMTERMFSAELYQDKHCVIEYFGTVDVILKSSFSNQVYVCDHKTTTSLGSDFINRVYPNFQYTGYVWLVRQNGLDASSYYVNGIQVAKTKQDLLRQPWTLNETDYAEFKNAIVNSVQHWLNSLRTQVFTQTAPNPCTQWGGCPYRDICITSPAIRENVIRVTYEGEN